MSNIYRPAIPLVKLALEEQVLRAHLVRLLQIEPWKPMFAIAQMAIIYRIQNAL